MRTSDRLESENWRREDFSFGGGVSMKQKQAHQPMEVVWIFLSQFEVVVKSGGL